MELTGKNVVVIGGGTVCGIGHCLVKELLTQKVQKIAVFDVNDPQKAKEDLSITFPHNSVQFRRVDVRSKDQIKGAFVKVISVFGRVDILFNCAGIFNENSVEDTIHVNLFGVIYSTQLAIEHMSLEKGGCGGTVVNVASTAGVDSSFLAPAYSASKHGVVGYTRSLSHEKYESLFGIKFIVICPGYTETTLVSSMASGVLRNDFLQDIYQLMSQMKRQSAPQCAKVILDTLNLSKNGSVWIIEGGQYTPVKFEKYIIQ